MNVTAKVKASHTAWSVSLFAEYNIINYPPATIQDDVQKTRDRLWYASQIGLKELERQCEGAWRDIRGGEEFVRGRPLPRILCRRLREWWSACMHSDIRKWQWLYSVRKPHTNYSKSLWMQLSCQCMPYILIIKIMLHCGRQTHHSNMSLSNGAAWYWSDGSMASSRTSAWMRRRDGDLLMILLWFEVNVVVLRLLRVLWFG